jgi:hypothetical protein
MPKKGLDPNTKTGRIHIAIFELLEKNKDGIQWTELARQVQKQDPSLHPKTLNGCIWKLTQTFPDEIEKPEKGLYRLKR